MSIIESEARVAVKNTLYLTDFSQPSEAALPFVVGMLFMQRVLCSRYAAPIIRPCSTRESSFALALPESQ